MVNQPKLIAEIGINHHGDIKKAKTLIDQAYHSGCWGVKFQYRKVSNFYKSSNEIGDEILLQEIIRTSLTKSDIRVLANYSEKLGLKFGLSFFKLEDFIDYQSCLSFVDFLKVPSAECTNTALIEAFIQSKKPVMVSTGGHSLNDILNVLQKYKKQLVIFHCVANYPAKIGSQNLNFIDTLLDHFPQVGYSSHDSDFNICFLALKHGATWIERHLTLDVNGIGLDDSSSSDFSEFKSLARIMNNYSLIQGDAKRKPNQGEIINMQNLGTGLYARKRIKKGSLLNLKDFSVNAPRTGLSVGEFIHKFSSKPLSMDIEKDASLTQYHFKKSQSKIAEDVLSFANRNLIGIPVRIHDFSYFKELIPTGVYEFHLSYEEADSINIEEIVKQISSSDKISIHLPDYLRGNRILDPVSKLKSTRSDSRKLIKNVQEFAVSISQVIGRKVPIIGSFSQRAEPKRKLDLEKIYEFVLSSKKSECSIYPQWLPVFAWYFGGTVQINLFNSEEDIEFIHNNNFHICLDICHVVLSANHYGQNWYDWYQLLENYTGHYHYANAEGVDGEGLDIDKGDIKDFSLFFGNNKMKILEVWQGHLNSGQGFINNLKTLHFQELNRKL